MRRMKLKSLMTMVALVGISLMACNPKDGEVGPAGPIGPEGAIGPKGDDGADGQDGRDGTDGQDGTNGVANISVSNFTVLSTDWVTGAATKTLADITAEVYNNGAVLAYIANDVPPLNTTWTAIPSGNFSFRYVQGSISFLTPGFTGANFDTYFKVVVIPPSMRIKNMDYSDYEVVNAVYDLGNQIIE